MLQRLSSGAGNCLNGSRLKIDEPDQMVLSVCEIKQIAIKSHALWPKEGRRIEGTAGHTARAGSNCFDQRSIEPGNNYSIVV